MAQLRNNTDRAARALDRAATGGLTAAANVYRNAVKRALAGGYTSGNYVTGHVQNSVTQTVPARLGTGYGVRVGTNVPYALFWELGHINIFSGRFEQVPIWLPMLEESAPEMRDVFTRVFVRLAQDGAALAPVPMLGTQLEMNPAASPGMNSPDTQ